MNFPSSWILSSIASLTRRAAAIVGTCALLGCSSLSSSEQPHAAYPTPLPGVLRFAEGREPTTLNTLLADTTINADLSYLLFSYFFDVDDKGNLVPDIATEVPTVANGGISHDGKTIVYHLRHNIRWQDGAPLTSKDVIFTYSAIMNPRNNVPQRTGYDQIQSVKAQNDSTVVVHMRRVFSPIVTYFMAQGGGVAILPAHILARYPDLNRVDWNQHPIGSGPFKLTEWVRSDHLTFEANPLYWRGPPRLREIVFRIIPYPNDAVIALQTHEVDAWFHADPAIVGEMRKVAGFDVRISPLNIFGHLDFNVRDPILADVNVRRAVESAIDRRRIIADTTGNLFQTTDTDQPEWSWAADHHAPFFPYDPGKAAALLEHEGWRIGSDGIRVRNGRRLSLQLSTTAGGGLTSKIAALVQEDERAVGVEVNIKTYPGGLFFAGVQDGGILTNGKYQLSYWEWVGSVDPDDSMLYSCDQFPPQGMNTLFWCDRTLDTAEKDALSHMDQQRRKADYHIISTELGEQAPTIFIYTGRRIDVVTDELSRFRPSPAGSGTWNVYQWSLQPRVNTR